MSHISNSSCARVVSLWMACKQLYATRWYLNALLFQVLWLLAVVFQNDYVVIVVCIVGLHFALTQHPKREIWTLVTAIVVGGGMDALLTYWGVWVFPGQHTVLLIPVWLWGLWAGFAMTLHYSIKWMLENVKVFQWAFPFFATGAYYSASVLQAVEIGYELPWVLLLTLALWSMHMVWIAKLQSWWHGLRG